MIKLSETLGLRSPDGREAQLLSVEVHGEVLGLMLRLSVRQTWRNTSGAPMATRLGIALTPEQCLLELRVERSAGPQPIHKVSRLSREVCTTGFGVMNTGEQVTLHWRIGQLLQLQGGSLRLQLPAALVPPALRPARLSFEIHDPVARGTLGSTTHEVQRVRHANGMTLHLQSAHGLDKDFGFTLHGLRETGFAIASPDLSRPGHCTVLASHSLQLGASAQAQRLRLKLVVDHTGVMAAERQSQILTALERLLGQLQPGDQLSCSRLGARLVHDLPRLQPCTEAYVRRARTLVRHAEIDPGVPDWPEVLQDLLGIPDEDEDRVQDANILLVTAQPLPSTAGVLQALRAAGHRLHVMTVGESASASLWPVLALASGGSCEALAPGQHSQPTLQRMLERMRSLRPVQAGLSVEGQALATPLLEHASMAEGDTLHLWAPMALPATPPDLTGRPQWRASLQWQTRDENAPSRSAAGLPVLWDHEGDLARLCATRQAMLLDADDERQALLAPHGLVLPDEQRMAMSAPPPPSARPATTPPPAAIAPSTATRASSADRPAPASSTPARVHAWPGPVSAPATGGHPIEQLVRQFNAQAPAYRQFRAALSATLQRVPTRTIDGLVMQLARQAGNPARVWALLLHWLHAEHELPLQAHALALVEQELHSVPVAQRNEVHALLAAAVQPQATRRAA